MLQDPARRHAGRVLALGGGDLVLLLPSLPDAGGQDEVAALPALLARLLRADIPDSERLVSLWTLPQMAGAFLAYATARAIEPPSSALRVTPAVHASEQISTVEALGAAADGPAGIDLLRRQTAVLLPRQGSGGTVLPLFREICFSIPTLEARVGLHGGARTDLFLFRHLARRLDERMLALLAEASGTGGPLDIFAQGAPPLHLNLTPAAVASPAFERFAACCQAAGMRAGIEITLLEACADPSGLAGLRSRVAAWGFSLVLDNISHLALELARVWMLPADLVKFDWTPHLMALGIEDAHRLDAAVARIGPGRLLLHHAESEEAVRWGLARGIRRFQGRHVEAMLAASRMAGCPWSGACELRQCVERGTVTAPASRRFCRNPALLDAGAPTAPPQAEAA